MTTVIKQALPGASGAGAVTDCPFPGLNFYTEYDATWFFGRDVERQMISANLRAGRLTVLYAESGAGKSSLLRAGVAAKLLEVAHKRVEAGRAPQYVPVVFSLWKDEPVDTLQNLIAATIRPFAPGGEVAALPRGNLMETINAASDRTGVSLLLILDQFEEYFLYRAGETEPGRFARELAECVNSPDVRANFLIAIREDAYAGLGDLFAGLIPNIYGNYLHLDFLNRDEAREAIEGPVRHYNEGHPDEAVELEDGLVDSVLDQVRVGGADAALNGSADLVSTPLLQLVMRAIWEHERQQSSRVLHLSTLSELKVETIVDAHLERALATLKRHEQEVATDVFDHLVTPSGGKIAEPVADLASRTGHDEPSVAAVLDKLDHARIVRPVPAPPGQDTQRYRRYEIFHDVLSPAINRAIAASMAEKRLRRARRIVALSLALLLLVLAAAGGFLLLWRNSVRDKSMAQSSALAALAQRSLTTDPELSALLALKAEKIAPTPQAADALAEALPDMQEIRTMSVGSTQTSVVQANFSPDGLTIVTADSNGTADIFSTQTGQLLKSIPASRSGKYVFSAAYNPGGDRIMTASEDGTAEVFDAQSRKRLLAPLTPHHSAGYYVRSAVYSPDGSTIATAYDGSPYGYVDLWTSSGRWLRTINASHIPTGTNYINDVAFSPDGTEIATANGDGTVNVFNVATTLPVLSPLVPGDNAVANTVAYSPNGRSLVVAYQDGRVVNWDLSTGQRTATFDTSGEALSAAFSPDGTEIVASNDLGQAVLWNVASRAVVTDLSAHVGLVDSVVFSPDGKEVLTANHNGTVTLWRAQRRVLGLKSNFYTGQAPVSVARYIPGTHIVIGANWTGGVTLWDPRTGGSRFLQGDPQGIGGLVIVPGYTSYTLYAVNNDGSATIWAGPLSDLKPRKSIAASNTSVFAFAPPNTGYIGYDTKATGNVGVLSKRLHNINTPFAVSAAFNPKGTELVTNSNDGVELWDPHDGKHIRTLAVPDDTQIFDAEFSSDGSRIVTADSLGNADVFDAATGERIAELNADSGQINRAFFAPGNDNEIVTAGDDGTARIWDVGSQTQLEVFSDPNTGAVNEATFNANGTEVLTGSVDGNLRVWSADIPNVATLVRQAQAAVNRSVSATVQQELLASS